MTFAADGASASATTGPDGVATATLALPSERYTLTARFAGDTDHESSRATRALIAYQATRFAIWGGNPGGVATGGRYQIWGARWARQVADGDYRGTGSFKGYADILGAEGQAWAASPGGAGGPPRAVARYIGVVVTEHVASNGATIGGTVDKGVVLRVDAPRRYQPNPGHDATGVLVATLP